MQEILSSNSPLATGICDPNKSQTQHHANIRMLPAYVCYVLLFTIRTAGYLTYISTLILSFIVLFLLSITSAWPSRDTVWKWDFTFYKKLQHGNWTIITGRLYLDLLVLLLCCLCACFILKQTSFSSNSAITLKTSLAKVDFVSLHLFNWDLPHARLRSHNEAWSYKNSFSSKHAENLFRKNQELKGVC